MAAEEPAVAIARMDGRLEGIERQLGTIQSNMATKEGAGALTGLVSDLRDALANERAERIAGDLNEKTEREKVAGRLQLLEDRMENRKYLAGTSIVIAVLGVILGLFGDAIRLGITGG